MSGKFADQVAVVTGASTGIGFAIAQGLIAEGARRVLHHRAFCSHAGGCGGQAWRQGGRGHFRCRAPG